MNKLNNMCEAITNVVAGLGLLLFGVLVTLIILIDIWSSSKLLFAVVIALILLSVWAEYLKINKGIK